MLDLPRPVRELHDLMDDYHAVDTEPYDYLRRLFDKGSFAETTSAVLETITALSAPHKNDPAPFHPPAKLEEAVNYGLYTTRQLGRWHPRSTLQFHDDLIAALPAAAEERCKVAHRSLQFMDSVIIWRPRLDETVAPETLITTAAQITESLRHWHRGDYVVDVAKGHTVAHLANYARVDLTAATILRGTLIDRLSADNPLRQMLSEVNLATPAKPHRQSGLQSNPRPA